jgi:hypothetical protein
MKIIITLRAGFAVSNLAIYLKKITQIIAMFPWTIFVGEVLKDEEETLQLLKEVIQNPAKKKEERAQLIHGFFEGKLRDDVILKFENIFEQITSHA